MWFVGVEVEQETSAPPPKKNPVSAPDKLGLTFVLVDQILSCDKLLSIAFLKNFLFCCNGGLKFRVCEKKPSKIDPPY